MANGNGKTGEYIRVAEGYLEIRQKVTAGKLSTSGKNFTVVSTGGFKPIEGSELTLNLIACKKA